MSQVVALPLAIPGTVIASLLGFHMLFVLQTQLRYVIKLVRGSDVEILKSVLQPPFAFLSSMLESTFGSKFTPSATHVLLGALIIALFVSRRW